MFSHAVSLSFAAAAVLHFFLKTCWNSPYECIKISNSRLVKNVALLFPVAMVTRPTPGETTQSWLNFVKRTPVKHTKWKHHKWKRKVTNLISSNKELQGNILNHVRRSCLHSEFRLSRQHIEFIKCSLNSSASLFPQALFDFGFTKRVSVP